MRRADPCVCLVVCSKKEILSAHMGAPIQGLNVSLSDLIQYLLIIPINYNIDI